MQKQTHPRYKRGRDKGKIIMEIQNHFAKYIVVLLVLINCFAYGQTSKLNQKNKIVLNYSLDNQKHYIKSIDFVNPLTKETINSFNIYQNNPYENLNYPKLVKRNEQDNKYYKINNVRIRDFSISEGKFNYRKDTPDTTKIINGFAGSYSAVFYSDTSHLIVLYELRMYQEDSFLGVSTSVFILTNNGSISHRLSFFETECHSPTITKNGKFFAYGYGGSVDENFSYLDSVGYVIYYLQKNKIIIDEIIDKKYYDALPYNYDNLIRVNCKSYQNRTYVIYDFENNRVYEKSYPIEQVRLIREVTDIGFIFEERQHGSGKFRTDYYKEVFKMGNIK